MGLCWILTPSTSVLSTAKRNSPLNNQCSPGGSANPGPMVSKALRASDLEGPGLEGPGLEGPGLEGPRPSHMFRLESAAPPRLWLLIFFRGSRVGALAWLACVGTPTSEPLITLPHPLIHAVSPCPCQVVCEAARSDSSSSPAAGEQSCRRGNSVEKGGPSQQPPAAKGPSKKK